MAAVVSYMVIKRRGVNTKINEANESIGQPGLNKNQAINETEYVLHQSSQTLEAHGTLPHVLEEARHRIWQ